MSRFSEASKSAIRIIAGVLLLVLVAGCYEGYKKPKGEAGGGEGKGGGGSKLYGFIFVDALTPSEEMLKDSRCSGIPSSLLEIRRAEIAQRVQSILKVAESLGDQVLSQITPLRIPGCRNFNELENFARAPRDEIQPPLDLREKPVLHLRVVIWYGDDSYDYPSVDVSQSEWAFFRRLGDLGFRRRTFANSFAVTGPRSLYLSGWQTASDPNSSLTAKTILAPIPTEAGIGELQAAAIESATALVNWLRERSTP